MVGRYRKRGSLHSSRLLSPTPAAKATFFLLEFYSFFQCISFVIVVHIQQPFLLWLFVCARLSHYYKRKKEGVYFTILLPCALVEDFSKSLGLYSSIKRPPHACVKPHRCTYSSSSRKLIRKKHLVHHVQQISAASLNILCMISDHWSYTFTAEICYCNFTSAVCKRCSLRCTQLMHSLLIEACQSVSALN